MTSPSDPCFFDYVPPEFSPLPKNLVPLTDLLREIHADLKPGIGEARLDRHERSLRQCLQSGELSCSLYHPFSGLQNMSKHLWDDDGFWSASHETWLMDGDEVVGMPVVDKLDGFKALGFTDVDLREPSDWLKEMPPALQSMPLAIFLPLIVKWKKAEGHDKAKRNQKSVKLWLDKNWPEELGEPSDRLEKIFFSLILRKRPR